MKQVYLVPTYKCNNRCIMCGVFNNKKDSSWEYNYEEVIEKLNKYDLTSEDHIIISGGEPTIYKYFFEVIEYINDSIGAKISIFSNGRALKHKNLVDKLKKLDVYNILIPLFGENAIIHDQFTDAIGSFDDTYRGLQNLNESNIKFAIKNIVTKINYENLPKWAEFISNNFQNAKQVSLHGLHLQGEAPRCRERLYVEHNIAAKYIENAAEHLIENDINFRMSGFPICTIDPYYWKYNVVANMNDSQMIAPDEEDIKNTNVGNYDNKLLVCTSCSVQNKCEWPWKMYEKFYKLDYIKAI